MALQGSYQIITIPDLLAFLQLHRLSGILVIASPTRDCSFYLQDGQVVYAMRNEPSQLIGEVLVRELDLDHTEVEKALQEEEGGPFLGEKLVRRGLITEEAVNQIMVLQIRRTLHEVLHWQEWAFHFQELSSPNYLPRLRLSTHSLVFDLAREIDEWQQVEKMFANLDWVLEPISSHVEAPLEREWGPNLLPLEQVLSEVDGRRSLRQILEASIHPVLPLARALAELTVCGVMRLRFRNQPTSTASQALNSCALPVIPHLPARILILSSPEEKSLAFNERFLLSDPVLAARILKVTALHSHWQEDHPLVTRELIERLGRESVQSILLAEAMRGLFLTRTRWNWYPLWLQSRRASLACRRLAEESHYRSPDEAHAAGLLQDIGRLVLATRDYEAYQEVGKLSRGGEPSLLEAEKLLFNTNHCQIGTEFAEAWGFPPALIMVIREHHSHWVPENRLLAIVRLVNSLLPPEPGHPPDEIPPPIHQAMLEILDLTPEFLEQVRAEILEPSDSYEGTLVDTVLP